MSELIRGEEGQGLVEFALVLPPVLLLLVFGLVELANVLSSGMTMASATREGARVASALVNGGGALGCGPGQSPNAATVDPNIIAAVERVLTGAGTRIVISQVTEIKIWKSTSSGNETVNMVNRWNYAPPGPIIDGQPLEFSQVTQQWLPCTRWNGASPDSAGITVTYTYRGITPLRMLVPMFNQFTMGDKAVMSMNASR